MARRSRPGSAYRGAGRLASRGGSVPDPAEPLPTARVSGVVDGWILAPRARPVAPMHPQELLRIASHDGFDRADEAPRVLDHVGFCVGRALERNLVVDLDHVTALVRLTHDKHRRHGRTG